MTDLIEARRSILQSQRNCPCCGSRLSLHVVSGSHLLTHFSCGAVFDVLDGEDLTFVRACPAPSTVAAAHLNGQAETLAGGLA